MWEQTSWQILNIIWKSMKSLSENFFSCTNLNAMVFNRTQCQELRACRRLQNTCRDCLERAQQGSQWGFTLTIFSQLLVHEARSGEEMLCGNWFCFYGFLTGVINREIISLKKLILNLWEKFNLTINHQVWMNVRFYLMEQKALGTVFILNV